jgi:hypothetical protein
MQMKGEMKKLERSRWEMIEEQKKSKKNRGSRRREE